MKIPALLALGLAACVPSSREVRAPVDRLIDERLGEPRGATSAPLEARALDALLARPLDADAATRIALALSPRLAAAFDALDVAAAEVAAALGLGPVELGVQHRFGSAHDETELDVVQNVVGLITAPHRRAAASADLAGARARAAAAALGLAAQVEIAFTDLHATEAEIALRRTAFDAADLAATVRDRMHAAGNASELARARDRDAREQARVALARAEAGLEARREAINALLGLSGPRTHWTSTGELRALPDRAPALDGLEAEAVAASLALTAGRARRDAAERRASAEVLRTFVPELGVGVAIADDGHETSVGPALRLAIPLFDLRSGERARARAEVRRADHELAAEAIELRAAARAARVTALATYDEARHLRDVILPLRDQIVDETVKHYNAMDADPFALIAARAAVVEARQQYVDALRRFWRAMAEVRALARGAAVGLARGAELPTSPAPTRAPEHP